MDPLQWMGAVSMRVQTADRSITIIHTTPVHQLMSCEVKSCVFVKNKSIIKHFNFKPSLLAKIALVHNAEDPLVSKWCDECYIFPDLFWWKKKPVLGPVPNGTLNVHFRSGGLRMAAACACPSNPQEGVRLVILVFRSAHTSIPVVPSMRTSADPASLRATQWLLPGSQSGITSWKCELWGRQWGFGVPFGAGLGWHEGEMFL